MTPGQAAFAKYWERSAGAPLKMPESWDMQPEGNRADWEAAAEAAIAANMLRSIAGFPFDTGDDT